MRAGYFICLLLLVKTGLAQVNLQNGASEQSFPLINYADSKSGMMLGVSLNYSSGGGLLVNDVASDMGTGWNLNAGGMISRIQVGQPDDQQAYFNGNKTGELSSSNYPAGYLYNTDQNKGCNVGIKYYPVFKDPTVYKEHNEVTSDLEQDKFVFRFNGRYGVFVIGKDWNAVMLGDSRVKINIFTTGMTGQGIRTTIYKFIITTEDGIKYTFQDLGLSKLCRYKYSRYLNNGVWTPLSGNPSNAWNVLNRYWGYPLGENERPYVVNSWFLSEIENSNNGAKINFEYADVYSEITTGKYVTHQRDLNNSCHIRDLSANNDRIRCGRMWFDILSRPAEAYNYSWNTALLDKLDAGATSLTYIRSISKSKRIKKITLSNSAIIEFKYHSLGRVDLPGENALSRVEYSLNGSLLRAYDLEHGYFYKNIIRDYTQPFTSFESKFARLCLLKIRKRGTGEDNVSEPPYQFTYYTSSASGNPDDIVPARNYLSQDHWGYYNGNISGLSPSEDHDFLGNEGQYYYAVTFKHHNAKSGYAKNGLLKSVIFPTGGSIYYYYAQNTPSSSILPASYPQLAGGVSVNKTILYDGDSHAKDIITEYAYVNASNTSSRWGDESPIYYSLSVTEYNEKWGKKKFKYPGVEFPEMMSSIDMAKSFGNALIGAAINFAVQTILNQVWSAAVPYLNAIMFVIGIVQLIINATKTFEFHRFILSNQNTGLSNGLGARYSRVEVRTNSPTGYNGKTVHEFRDKTDYPLLVSTLQWPYVQEQRSLNWAYGLPKRVAMYDNLNRLVSETKNDYTVYKEKIADLNNLNCLCTSRKKLSLNGNDWSNKAKTWFSQTDGDLTKRPYFGYTGRTDLYTSSEKSYKEGNLYFTSNTQVLTDPATLLQKGKITVRDDLTLLIQSTYYPKDYTITGGAIEKLKLNNAIHTPIATETWLLVWSAGISTLPVGLYLLDANITEYQVYTFNGQQQVKPWKTHQLKIKTPLPESVIGAHNPALLIRNSNYFKLTGEMFYDNDGNLIQTKSDENISSYINDYADRYVVASVANSEQEHIAYAGFESTGKGKWTYDAAFVKPNGLTGYKCFNLGFDATLQQTSTITRTGLNAGKTYVVTYWQKPFSGDNVSVNGQTGTFLYAGPEGWRLYQHEVTGVTQLTITGAALVDELRLYPKGALMTTSAYKDGIGKVTECDANNRLLFYEYDGLGRIRMLRDQQKNVIKTYEYNYKR